LVDLRPAADRKSISSFWGDGVHELYLMCNDLKTEMASLAKKGVTFSKVEEARWGSITKMRLPSGGNVGLSQPKHTTAI
jgi:hypothetical protein